MKRSLRLTVLLLVVAVIGLVFSPLNHSSARNVQSSEGIAGKYLLNFQFCDRAVWEAHHLPNGDCDVRFTRLYIAQSDDGITWDHIPGFEPFLGNTADIIRRDDTLYVYYQVFEELQPTGIRPVPTVRKYHFDTDRWDEPRPLKLRGTRPPNRRRFPEEEIFIEPSVILNANRSIVLFYRLEHHDSYVFAPRRTEYFRSATEVEGSDGTEFVVDEGERITVEIRGEGGIMGQKVGNPEIMRGRDEYILYIAEIGGGSVCTKVYTSQTLRGDYTLMPGLPNGHLMCNLLSPTTRTYYNPVDDESWTYGTRRGPALERLETLRAVHKYMNRPLTGSSLRTVLRVHRLPGMEDAVDVREYGFAVNEP